MVLLTGSDTGPYRIASNKRPTSRKRLPRINAPLLSHIIFINAPFE